MMELEIIAKIHTDFPTKFALPRQSMLNENLRGEIEFLGKYKNPDCLRGLEGYSHLWLLWGFSEKFASREKSDGWNPTVRPPRLGGNTRVGVFATRSPNRPNPIGLSVVKIVSIDFDNVKITVSGIDMTDGTPIYDIKPYLPHVDSVPDAKGGFAGDVKDASLSVEIPDELKIRLEPEKLAGLIECLREDPRPSYQHDSREYGFPYARHEVRFVVDGDRLTVTGID